MEILIIPKPDHLIYAVYEIKIIIAFYHSLVINTVQSIREIRTLIIYKYVLFKKFGLINDYNIMLLI